MADDVDITTARMEYEPKHRAMPANNVPPVIEDGAYICAECGEDNGARGSLGYGRCIECQEEADGNV